MYHECNREEALRCAEAAMQQLHEGNVEMALKLLKQSNRLYPSEKVTAEIQRVEELLARKTESTKAEAPPASTSSSTSNSPPKTPEPSSPLRTHTKEQLEIVRKILRSKNYYEVLEIARECTENDIKKAYRRLAVLVHPDKNPAPGAEEAFKRVAEAFSFLSDSSKREKYDRYGHEEALRRERTGGAPRYGTNMQDITPEELFNMFFNMPNTSSFYYFPRRNTWPRNRPFSANASEAQSREAPSQPPLLGVLLQLLPILLLMLFAMVGSPFGSRRHHDPLFSFEPEGAFRMERKTERLGLRYFVAPDFETKMKEDGLSIGDVEDYAEEVWLKHLQNQCYAQRQQKQLKIDQARYRWTGVDKEALENANAIKTPACDEYTRLRKAVAAAA